MRRVFMSTAAVSIAFLLLCSCTLVCAQVNLADMTPAQLHLHGNQLIAAGDAEGAIQVFKYVIDNVEDEGYIAGAHNCLAGILSKQNQTLEAIAHLNIIRESYPNSNTWCRGTAPQLLVSLLLHRQMDPQGAADIAKEVLEAHGDGMVPKDRAILLHRLAECYIKLDRQADAMVVLERGRIDCPYLLNIPVYHQLTVDHCLAQKDYAGALSAARAGYALARFYEAEIKSATELVRKVFMAQAEIAKATQFLAAQEDPTAPNPLADVALPTIPDEDRQRLLQVAAQDPATAVTVHLYLGNNQAALDEAVLCMAEAPAEKSLQAIREVARVFKAADLNLGRANAFINYAKTGEGQNPLMNPNL